MDPLYPDPQHYAASTNTCHHVCQYPLFEQKSTITSWYIFFFFSKGNEAFVSEDYSRAIELYRKTLDSLPFYSWDLGWVKYQDPDPGFTIRIIVSRAFLVEILKFFNADPGSGVENSRIRDPNPQHWIQCRIA
jgi:hypothetical protein